MLREEIAKIVQKSLKNLQEKEVFLKFPFPEIDIGHPKEGTHGDYATNVAFQISRYLKKNPLEIGETIKLAILKIEPNLFEKIEVIKPGFINFFLSPKYLQLRVKEILNEGERFGKVNIGKSEKVNLEFISANPTGPLTLGNGRGGFCGDVLANILEKSGFKVIREYYINDKGGQIRALGHSVMGDELAVYKGDYIEELKKKVKGDNPDEVGQEAARIILEEMIKPTVKKMGIEYDVWTSEKKLYEDKEVEKILSFLKKKKLTFEKEGALWFASSKFGDDKDRVLITADGESVYFLSDIAYLKNKLDRGFNKLIFFWGADHHGYIGRIIAAAEALGFSREKVKIIIMQLVKLFKEGKEVRMSKRAGVYVTLNELIDEVGLDVARFFFLERAPGSHLNFDLDLARERSEKNPVYYIQYAHARICSILRKAENLEFRNKNLELLKHPSELALMKELIILPEIVVDTAKDYQIQRLPQYAKDLAAFFHQFYRDCQVLTDNKELKEARLSLITATQIALKNTLGLMGISAPEKM